MTPFSSKHFSSVAPYTTAYETNGLLFFSGQVPLDPETKKIVRGDITVTAQRVLDNIQLLLDETNLSIKHVVKCTVYLADMADFKQLNIVYGNFFGDHKPSRTCIAVKELPSGVNVEIEFIAARNA